MSATIEEALRAAVRAELSPIVDQVGRLREEVNALQNRLPPLLVPVQEAARLCGVSLKTARRRVADGSWPIRRDGRRVLVDLARLHGLNVEDVAAMAREARG